MTNLKILSINLERNFFLSKKELLKEELKYNDYDIVLMQRGDLRLDSKSLGYKKIKQENSLSIIHGDALSLSIAAASVIAKVTRDEIMYELDRKYPEYDFKSHKGYPTKKHLENIKKYGILNNYRFSYKPIKNILEEDNEKTIKQ